jgi:hypothetical protein
MRRSARFERNAATEFVIPAQAGIQGFQSLSLGPRFREGDELMGREFFHRLSA